jgi:hypothetical protein
MAELPVWDWNDEGENDWDLSNILKNIPPTNSVQVSENSNGYDKQTTVTQNELIQPENIIDNREPIKETPIPKKSENWLKIQTVNFIPIKGSSIYETEPIDNKLKDNIKTEIKTRLEKSKFENQIKKIYNIVWTPEIEYEIIDKNKTKTQRPNKPLLITQKEFIEHERLVKQKQRDDFIRTNNSLKRPREESIKPKESIKPREESMKPLSPEPEEGWVKFKKTPQTKRPKLSLTTKKPDNREVIVPPTFNKGDLSIKTSSKSNPPPKINPFKNSEYLIKTSPENKKTLFEYINNYSIHKSNKNKDSQQSIYNVHFDSSVAPYQTNWIKVAVPFFKIDLSHINEIKKKYKLINETLSVGQTSTRSYVFKTSFQDPKDTEFQKLLFGRTDLRLVSKIIDITSRFSQTEKKFVSRNYNSVNSEMFDLLNEIKVSYFLNILLFGFDTILSPNFMINIDWFQIKWKDFLPFDYWTIPHIIANKDDIIQVLVSEMLDKDLKSFLMGEFEIIRGGKNRIDPLNLWKTLQFCLFETFHFLETAYLATGFISYDFHITNCMVNNYQEWTKITLLYERFGRKGVTYAINQRYHKGNLIKIFDFGRSRIYPRLKNMRLKKDQMKLIYHNLHDKDLNINEKENLFIDTRVFIGSLCLQLDKDFWKFMENSFKGNEWMNIIKIFDNALGLENWKNHFVKKDENKERLEQNFKKNFPLINSIYDFSCTHLMDFKITDSNKEDIFNFMNMDLLFIQPFEGQSGMTATNLLDSKLFEDLKIDPKNEPQYIYLSRPNDEWILK